MEQKYIEGFEDCLNGNFNNIHNILSDRKIVNRLCEIYIQDERLPSLCENLRTNCFSPPWVYKCVASCLNPEINRVSLTDASYTLWTIKLIVEKPLEHVEALFQLAVVHYISSCGSPKAILLTFQLATFNENDILNFLSACGLQQDRDYSAVIWEETKVITEWPHRPFTNIEIGNMVDSKIVRCYNP